MTRGVTAAARRRPRAGEGAAHPDPRLKKPHFGQTLPEGRGRSFFLAGHATGHWGGRGEGARDVAHEPSPRILPANGSQARRPYPARRPSGRPQGRGPFRAPEKKRRASHSTATGVGGGRGEEASDDNPKESHPSENRAAGHSSPRGLRTTETTGRSAGHFTQLSPHDFRGASPSE